MPVIAKFCGIVIRLVSLRGFGPRLHACFGDSEMVVDLASLRIIEANVSDAVRAMVMAWAKQHQGEVMAGLWQPLPPRALSNRFSLTA